MRDYHVSHSLIVHSFWEFILGTTTYFCIIILEEKHAKSVQ